MKSIFKFACLTLAWAGASLQAEAGTLQFSGRSGIPLPHLDTYCDVSAFSVTGMLSVGNGNCGLHFPITLEPGRQISSVTLYYFDDAGSQNFKAEVYKMPLSSLTEPTLLGSAIDNMTSPSVQFSTINVSKTVEAGYSYFVEVRVGLGLEFLGLKVNYL